MSLKIHPKIGDTIFGVLFLNPECVRELTKLLFVAQQQNKRFQNGSLPRVVSPDDQVRATEILELDVFEAAELFEFKVGNHVWSGKLTIPRYQVKTGVAALDPATMAGE